MVLLFLLALTDEIGMMRCVTFPTSFFLYRKNGLAVMGYRLIGRTAAFEAVGLGSSPSTPAYELLGSDYNLDTITN